jgi:putative ABC transport system permease protein
VGEWLNSVLLRLRALLRGQRHERDIDEELSFHQAMREGEYRRAGLDSEAARSRTRARFGRLERIREECLQVWSLGPWDRLRLDTSIGHDVAYGARMLAKRPGLTTLALATLALGVGSSTAMFSIVDTVVLRPPPYRDPGRLYKVCLQASQESQRCDDTAMSLADLRDLRHQSRTLREIAADDGDTVKVEHADGSRESVGRALVTVNWLSVLGVRPVLGRDFTPGEDAPDRARVAILGNDYWRRRFAGDPRVVGSTLVVGGKPCTVIGVLPPNVLRYRADLLMPLVPAEYPTERAHRDLDAFGRLAPGFSLAEARAEIQTIAGRLEQQYPVTNKDRTGRFYRLAVAPTRSVLDLTAPSLSMGTHFQAFYHAAVFVSSPHEGSESGPVTSSLGP